MYLICNNTNAVIETVKNQEIRDVDDRISVKYKRRKNIPNAVFVYLLFLSLLFSRTFWVVYESLLLYKICI